MGEAGFARPERGGAAAHHGHERRRVVWRPQGRQRDEPAAGQRDASRRVDHRDLERRPGTQRRQQRGQAGGQHRLARARRTEQEQVVATGRRHLDGETGNVLAAHLGQVGRHRARVAPVAAEAGPATAPHFAAPSPARPPRPPTGPTHARQRGFVDARRRDHHTGFAQRGDQRDHPGDTPHRPVETRARPRRPNRRSTRPAPPRMRREPRPRSAGPARRRPCAPHSAPGSP